MKKYSDEWIESGMVSHDDVKQLRDNWLNAQHRLHLTAFGAGGLAFLAGFVVCWLAFVR